MYMYIIDTDVFVCLQTHTQHEKREKLQEKHKALLEARLAKVRERKFLSKSQRRAAHVAGSTNTQDIADFHFDKAQGSGSEKPKPDRNKGTYTMQLL